MGNIQSIKQHIQALRDEIDRQRDERQKAVDRFEKDLLGTISSNGDMESPNIPHVTHAQQLMKVPAAIKKVLIESGPDGLTSSEIADQTIPMIASKAKNKRTVVFSSLFNLKKRGIVRCEEDRYYLVSQTDE